MTHFETDIPDEVLVLGGAGTAFLAISVLFAHRSFAIGAWVYSYLFFVFAWGFYKEAEN